MALSIVQRQNYFYLFLIISTMAAAIFLYHTTQKKWIMFRQGEIQFYKQHFDQAIESYQKAMAIGAITPIAFVHLADSYVATGKFKEAIPWYQKYLERFPKDADARFSYANALNWNGNIEEAKEEYQQVLQQHEMDKNSLKRISH